MYSFIVNPIAGNGKAKKIYESIRHLPILQNKATFYLTEYEGHAKEIVRMLESNKAKGEPLDILFVIGGDGTVHEVVNALSDQEIRICYIPGGSGNDFARGIESDKRPKEIIERAILDKDEKTYWLGTYTADDGITNKFVNSIGFGFDAAVVNRARKLAIRKLLSVLRLNEFVYLFALLVELVVYKPLEISLHLDGKEKTFKNVLFATVSNQPFMGGGMKINPDAHNNHEDFSVLVVDNISKWKVFFLFGTVFFGKHTAYKEVYTFKTKEVTVRAHQRIPYQVDGEYGKLKAASIRKFPQPLYIKGAKKNNQVNGR